MENPFDLSFEEIMAQATANLAADKGETQHAAQSQTTVPAQAAPAQAAPAQNATGEKTFLEMVEEAEKGKETPKTETQPASGIPAGMSFADLEKQAVPAMNPPVVEKTEEVKSSTTTSADDLSFESMMAKAQAVSATPSFDDMFNQAEGNVASKAEEPKTEEPKTEEPKIEEPKTEEPKTEEPKTEEPKTEEPKAEKPKAEEPKAEEPFGLPTTGNITFNDLVAQAEQMAETPVQEEPVQEEPAKEESIQEESVQEESVQEESVQEESVQEEPAKGKAKKGKKASDKKEEEPKEVLPDTTDEYEVDLTGKDKPAKEDKPQVKEPIQEEQFDRRSMYPDSLENLFSKDEMEAFRLMIHSFVRKELKRAMVGAMTDLLSEFKDE